MEKAMPTMLTLKELAKQSSLSYDRLRKLCLCGEIVHVKAGKKFLVNKEKFIEYLNVGNC